MPGLSLFLLAAFVLPQGETPQSAPDAVVADAAAGHLTFKTLVERVYDSRWMLQEVKQGEALETIDWSLDPQGQASIDIDGTGAVTRIWMSHAVGTVRVYVDGSDQAAIDWDLETMFSKRLPGYLSAPLFMQLGSGFVCKIPLPFNDSMRIVLEGPAMDGIRGDVAVRRFGKGVELESLTSETLSANLRPLRFAAQLFRDNTNPETLGEAPISWKGGFRFHEPMTGEDEDYYYGDFRVPILGDGVLRWFEIEFHKKLPPDEMREMLRHLTLRMELNTVKSSVVGDILFELPLGDFFGTTPGLNPFQSHLVGFNEATGVFYFRMPVPFTGGLKISLSSDIREVTIIKTRWGVNKYASPEDVPPLRLHSGWVRSSANGVPKDAQLDIASQARLIGYSFSSAAPTAAEQKFTGAFQFLNAWKDATPMAFEQLTLREGPGSFGHRSAFRLFGLDAPTSSDRLTFNPGVELAGGLATDYTAFAWWYAPVDSTTSFAVDAPFETRWPLPMPAANFYSVTGAFECENLDGALMGADTSTEVFQSPDANAKWSRLQFLDWQPNSAEQFINFPFPINDSGRFEVYVQFAQGEKYGKVQVLVDGRRVGEEMDMSSLEFAPSGEVKVGEVRLMKRLDHKIAFKSVDGKAIGLDYFRFQAVAKPSDSDNSEN
ncbi:MAG: DUF2961 domain-containing protein [Planctomycetes bacterium]|nr:DUF2961 domain-containing protein [Planctomycetota bacterium]